MRWLDTNYDTGSALCGLGVDDWRLYDYRRPEVMIEYLSLRRLTGLA